MLSRKVFLFPQMKLICIDFLIYILSSILLILYSIFSLLLKSYFIFLDTYRKEKRRHSHKN